MLYLHVSSTYIIHTLCIQVIRQSVSILLSLLDQGMILANRVAQSVIKRVLGGLGGLWVGGISLPASGR